MKAHKELRVEVRRLLRKLDRDKRFKQPDNGTDVWISYQREEDLRTALKNAEEEAKTCVTR